MGTRSVVEAIRQSARVADWPEAQLVQVIAERCAVSRLRAHRLARGWTLQDVVNHMKDQIGRDADNLGHTRVSRWETGERPSPRYLDALCRLYQTRADLLGFGISYAPAADDSAERTDHPPAAVPSSTVGEEEDGMRRRTVLYGMTFGMAGELSSEVLDAVEKTQEMLQRALSTRSSVNRETVEFWQERVTRHARDYRSLPARAQVKPALLEFDALCRLLEQRQSISHQAALITSTARLAGLIGILLVDLGQPHASRNWFRAGVRAANEVEDAPLAAWLMTRHALSCLYYEGPQAAVTMARHAQSLTRGNRSVAATLAPSVEARALAQVGHGREAVTLMRISEQRFMGAADAAPSEGAFGFSREKMLFYKGNVLARTGRPGEAVESCRTALLAYPRHDVVDRAHIRMDEALALLRLGEADASAKTALEALNTLPASAGVAAVHAQTEELIRRMTTAGASASARLTRDALRARQPHPAA
ncbi:helix-turn-helix transcriptional regulator [Micromonospora sp. WMMD998]|uniref:helix-turn-helix domain-containing protein n=1 Tax=Micromonospora sp. WMMD998 TaxID=3016092 RepID=UPI00249AC4B6|nr:helix-turn-helix transcriptional regulator [Micromonospora sp. WMMD998]WFE39981.1 helix-turn-helix transcriptional regulator [Micromonospora sp. WMMD998]